MIKRWKEKILLLMLYPINQILFNLNPWFCRFWRYEGTHSVVMMSSLFINFSSQSKCYLDIEYTNIGLVSWMLFVFSQSMTENFQCWTLLALKREHCDVMGSLTFLKIKFIFGFTSWCSIHMQSFKALDCPEKNKLGGYQPQPPPRASNFLGLTCLYCIVRFPGS